MCEGRPFRTAPPRFCLNPFGGSGPGTRSQVRIFRRSPSPLHPGDDGLTEARAGHLGHVGATFCLHEPGEIVGDVSLTD
jgi:hypothetical protein